MQFKSVLHVAFAVLLSLFATAHPARACANEVLGDADLAKATRAAESQLDKQDFVQAREQAEHILASRQADAGLRRRAERVRALATVRDPNKQRTDASSVRQMMDAVAALEGLAKEAPTDATLQVDLGEALEQDPDTHPRAIAILRDHAKRDLIGSAYAYAALARLEKTQGHPTAAAEATARCERTAVQPSMCRGKKPRSPWFRAPGWAYAGFGLLAAIFTLWQVFTLRRPLFRRVPPNMADSIVHVIGVTAPVGICFVAPTWPTIALLLGAMLTVACGAVAHALRVQTVVSGRVPGLVVRKRDKNVAAEEQLPILLDRADLDLVVEEVPAGASYRTSARTLLGRIAPKRASGSRLPSTKTRVAIALAVMVVGFSLSAMMTLSRSSPSSARSHAEAASVTVHSATVLATASPSSSQ